MTYEELCREPIAALPEGEPETSFGGRWEDRLWLNVPGPFCTGITDNCWTGRLHAPRHVLYGGEYFGEYVYRQPATTAEVLNLMAAARKIRTAAVPATATADGHPRLFGTGGATVGGSPSTWSPSCPDGRPATGRTSGKPRRG
ncbi:hypothetical protein GCM10010415_66220 [Streptomyces atrovirens]